MTRFLRGETGAALVEFAIVLPFLILTLFAMISWGYSLTVIDTMYDAARKAARELSVSAVDEAGARATAQANLTQWSQTFVVVAEDVGTTGTHDVRVQIKTNNFFNFMVPIVPALPDLSAEVVMRKES